MKTIKIRFEGPLSFFPGENSLFHSKYTKSACVYLWTVKSRTNNEHFIHYIGETGSFAKRQKEHLIQILGLNYGIFDPEKARDGIQERIWDGLWRDKSADGIGALLSSYEKINSIVLKYIEILNVFLAETEFEAAVRKHIEASIAYSLRNNHPDYKGLYPDDNHVGLGRKLNQKLMISATEKILGLDEQIDI